MAVDKHMLDFGELANDDEFIERIQNFETSLSDVTKIIDDLIASDVYNDLSPADKVRYDLFVAFTINALYWFYLRTQGQDPSQGDLKHELNRVKEYMTKSRKLYERENLMPRLNKPSAGRFIRSALWQPENEKEEKNLKRKRSESD